MKTYDVGVIGCGIIGSVAAIYLARKHLNVCVIEQDSHPLRGSTLAGFGALTPYSDPFFTGEIALFAERSLELYKHEWLKYLEAESGTIVPLSKSGLIQLFENDFYFEKIKTKYKEDVIPGYRPKILETEQVYRCEPRLTAKICGGLLHPEPWIDLAAYRSAITACLASLENIDCLFEMSVNTIEPGNPIHIFSEGKPTISCEYLVLATGINSLNVPGLPQITIHCVRGDGIAVRTDDNKPLFKHNLYMDKGFISPRTDGLMLLGSTYVDEGDTPPPEDFLNRESIRLEAMDEILRATLEISSRLGGCTVERLWRGWRPKSQDDLPVLGPHAENPNIIVASGFLGLGITMSPAVGEAIAEYVTGGIGRIPESLSPKRLV